MHSLHILSPSAPNGANVFAPSNSLWLFLSDIAKSPPQTNHPQGGKQDVPRSTRKGEYATCFHTLHGTFTQGVLAARRACELRPPKHTRSVSARARSSVVAVHCSVS